MVSRCLLFHNDVIQASCLPFTLQDVRSCMHLLTLTGFRDTACCYKQPDVFCGVLSCSSSSDNATLKQPVRLCTTVLGPCCTCVAACQYTSSLLCLLCLLQARTKQTPPFLTTTVCNSSSRTVLATPLAVWPLANIVVQTLTALALPLHVSRMRPAT